MVEQLPTLALFDHEPSAKPYGGCANCGSGKGAARCGNGLEKIYPTTAVRFGYMRYIGEFKHAPELKFTCGAKVVIQTKRGIELGEQVSLTCNGCDKSVTREEMKSWVKSCGDDTYMFDAGRILREATAADLAEFARIQAGCRAKRQFAQRLADRHQLPIKVVECECPLGGERIIFFFMAAERVDFRGMVKELASEYRTRIEMRQIGARDEARLLADYETCGREVCCKVFLKTLKPISMRMAKLQKATLDPTQVSGRCGRLKCCLRYEHMGYEELDKRLPRIGVRIRTQHGEGVVINRQILTQLVQIRTDSKTIMAVVAEDISAVNVPTPVPPSGDAPPEPQAREKASTRGSEGRAGDAQPARERTRKRPGRAPNRRHRSTPRQDQEDGHQRAASGSREEGEQPRRRRKRKRRRRRDRGSQDGGGSKQDPSGPREGPSE